MFITVYIYNMFTVLQRDSEIRLQITIKPNSSKPKNRGNKLLEKNYFSDVTFLLLTGSVTSKFHVLIVTAKLQYKDT